MRRRSFLRSLPVTAALLTKVARGDDNGLIPIVGDIHTLLLPDQTRIIVELDGTCPIEISQGPHASVKLKGAIYLPGEDDKIFSSGPVKALKIHTPSYEMFKTSIELDTTVGSRVNASLSGNPPRLIVDVYGPSLAGSTTASNPELAELEEKARQEVEQLKSASSNGTLGLRIRTIVIDPGHGGHDPGAVGLNGTKEKDITLAVGLKLAHALRKSGLSRVYLTRTEDYYLNLSDRTATANQYRADLFISLHCNGHPNRKARGCETFFYSKKASDEGAERVAWFENSFAEPGELQKKESLLDIEWILFKLQRKLLRSDSGEIASQIQGGLEKNLPVKNRGVKFANFYVLKKAKMPSILVESAFISNPDEEKLLRSSDFQERLVDSLVSRLKVYTA